MADARRIHLLVVAAGLVLFCSVGIRQGFGLFLVPVIAGGAVTRTDFSLAVALQYLIWGCAGPVAAKLANRIGSEIVLAIGGALYAAGFWGASLSASAWQFIACAGGLIGLGLGLANYGVVNGLVSNAVGPRQRGRALGLVGSLTALGQLALLVFTYGALGAAATWRGAFQAHAAFVLAIVPLAYLLWRLSPARHAAAPSALDAAGRAPLARDLLLLCVGFGLSGLQVMFTMTHLPALLAMQGRAAATATWMLVILSASSFMGSYLMGRLSETVDNRRLLGALYAARALAAAVFPLLPPAPWAYAAYFFALGFVWNSTFPVATALTADLFGAQRLALMFGYVFLAHQLGGFAGTWLGGIVAERNGDYAAMFPIVCAGCLLASATTFFISKAPLSSASGSVYSLTKPEGDST